jgi:hypothetical protein
MGGCGARGACVDPGAGVIGVTPVPPAVATVPFAGVSTPGDAEVGITIAFINVNGSLFAPPPTHPVSVIVCGATELGGFCAEAVTAHASAAAQKSRVFMTVSFVGTRCKATATRENGEPVESQRAERVSSKTGE